jgi:hypothetical protein
MVARPVVRPKLHPHFIRDMKRQAGQRALNEAAEPSEGRWHADDEAAGTFVPVASDEEWELPEELGGPPHEVAEPRQVRTAAEGWKVFTAADNAQLCLDDAASAKLRGAADAYAIAMEDLWEHCGAALVQLHGDDEAARRWVQEQLDAEYAGPCAAHGAECDVAVVADFPRRVWVEPALT